MAKKDWKSKAKALKAELKTHLAEAVPAKAAKMVSPLAPAHFPKLPLIAGAAALDVRMHPPGLNAKVVVGGLALRFIHDARDAIALSAVGLQAADAGMVARLLREASDQYPHYRRSAQAFATRYRDAHFPDAVIRQLTSRPRAR